MTDNASEKMDVRAAGRRGLGPAGRGEPMKLVMKFGGYQEPASIHTRAASRFGELLSDNSATASASS